DRLIVISKQQSVEIGEKFRVGRREQIKVIPLGLDLGIFADHASRRTRFRHELCIPDHTILIVIGDGGLRATLEAQSEALGLDKDVIFVGTRKDPEYFYPALDVVALTSRNE